MHPLAALALILELLRRTEGLEGRREWVEIAQLGTDAQPGLLRTLRNLKTHLDSNPSLLDTMSWLINRFVLQAHETVAYSKFPEFTFRFRWIEGRLNFYSHDALSADKFDLADIRHDAISTITQDLGYWQEMDGTASLTEAGRELIEKVFGQM
jgi:hypothetical protein